jgi:hypothetical protein
VTLPYSSTAQVVVRAVLGCVRRRGAPAPQPGAAAARAAGRLDSIQLNSSNFFPHLCPTSSLASPHPEMSPAALVSVGVDSNAPQRTMIRIMAIRPMDPAAHSWSLPDGPLWRDDLRRICSLMVEAGKADLTIRVDNFELDAANDLDALYADHSGEFIKGKIRRFEVSCDAGRIRVVFDESRRVLTIKSPSIADGGLASALNRLIRESDSRTLLGRFPRLARQSFGWFVFFVAAALLVIGFFEITVPDLWTRNADVTAGSFGLFVAILFLVLFSTSTSIWFNRIRSVMYIATWSEAPPWLERNKDGLLTNVIVSAGFLALGWIAGFVTSRK